MPKPVVYVMGDAEQRLVKIGWSGNLPSRFSSIQTACPFDLKLHWSRPGAASLETALHQHFASYHRRGEWFEFPDGNAAVLVSAAAEQIQPLEPARTAAPEQPSKTLDGYGPLPYATWVDSADPDIARALSVPQGTAVLCQQRMVFENDEPVEVSMTWARQGRVKSRIRRKSADGTVVTEYS